MPHDERLELALGDLGKGVRRAWLEHRPLGVESRRAAARAARTAGRAAERAHVRLEEAGGRGGEAVVRGLRFDREGHTA